MRTIRFWFATMAGPWVSIFVVVGLIIDHRNAWFRYDLFWTLTAPNLQVIWLGMLLAGAAGFDMARQVGDRWAHLAVAGAIRRPVLAVFLAATVPSLVVIWVRAVLMVAVYPPVMRLSWFEVVLVLANQAVTLGVLVAVGVAVGKYLPPALAGIGGAFLCFGTMGSVDGSGPSWPATTVGGPLYDVGPNPVWFGVNFLVTVLAILILLALPWQSLRGWRFPSLLTWAMLFALVVLKVGAGTISIGPFVGRSVTADICGSTTQGVRVCVVSEQRDILPGIVDLIEKVYAQAEWDGYMDLLPMSFKTANTSNLDSGDATIGLLNDDYVNRHASLETVVRAITDTCQPIEELPGYESDPTLVEAVISDANGTAFINMMHSWVRFGNEDERLAYSLELEPWEKADSEAMRELLTGLKSCDVAALEATLNRYQLGFRFMEFSE